MPDVTQLVNTADYAARQSDRWLFVSMLIFFGFCCWMGARYFVKRDEVLRLEVVKRDEVMRLEVVKRDEVSRIEANTARDHYEKVMETIVKDLTVILTRNTEALDGCRVAMEKYGDRSSECSRIQEILRRSTVVS
jgi:hypothetical protein